MALVSLVRPPVSIVVEKFFSKAAAVSIRMIGLVIVLFALVTTIILPDELAVIMETFQKQQDLVLNGNCTDCTNTVTTSLEDLWTTVIAIVDDPRVVVELVRQRIAHHRVHTIVPWIVTTAILTIPIICLVVVRCYTRRHKSYRAQYIRTIVTTALHGLVVTTTKTTTSADDGNGDSNSNNNVCGICLEGLYNTRKHNHCDHRVVVEGAVCPHVFHKDCINQWLLCRRRQSLSSQCYHCPLCRQDFLDAASIRKLNLIR